MKRRFWTSEKLLSLSAVLVSASTLIVFLYQTNLIRKQQYMSVYPYLELAHGGSATLNYQYSLSNEGIGPAFIKSVKVTGEKGKTYNDVVFYVDDKIQNGDSVLYVHSNIFEGKIVKVGERITLIGLADKELADFYGVKPNDLQSARILRNVLISDSLFIEIEYESVYEERWKITNNSHIPEKID